jgi:hypothetical protein
VGGITGVKVSRALMGALALQRSEPILRFVGSLQFAVCSLHFALIGTLVLADQGAACCAVLCCIVLCWTGLGWAGMGCSRDIGLVRFGLE